MNPELLAQLLAQGQSQPRKKRGGLAGIWDRNKGIIKPVVAGGLGALTGGLALPALAGGLMSGLDREGKGGVGFDVGQGVGGAVAGAAAGAAGKGLRGMLSRGAGTNAGQVVAGQGVPQGAVQGSSTPLGVGHGISEQAMEASSAGNRFQRGLSGALNFAKKNPQAIGMGLQGAAGILGGQRDERMERERIREEQRRAQNLGLFAAPLFRNMGGM